MQEVLRGPVDTRDTSATTLRRACARTDGDSGYAVRYTHRSNVPKMQALSLESSFWLPISWVVLLFGELSSRTQILTRLPFFAVIATL